MKCVHSIDLSPTSLLGHSQSLLLNLLHRQTSSQQSISGYICNYIYDFIYKHNKYPYPFTHPLSLTLLSPWSPFTPLFLCDLNLFPHLFQGTIILDFAFVILLLSYGLPHMLMSHTHLQARDFTLYKWNNTSAMLQNFYYVYLRQTLWDWHY